jgi:hypothetical protein
MDVDRTRDIQTAIDAAAYGGPEGAYTSIRFAEGRILLGPPIRIPAGTPIVHSMMTSGRSGRWRRRWRKRGGPRPPKWIPARVIMRLGTVSDG